MVVNVAPAEPTVESALRQVLQYENVSFGESVVSGVTSMALIAFAWIPPRRAPTPSCSRRCHRSAS